MATVRTYVNNLKDHNAWSSTTSVVRHRANFPRSPTGNTQRLRTATVGRRAAREIDTEGVDAHSMQMQGQLKINSFSMSGDRFTVLKRTQHRRQYRWPIFANPCFGATRLYGFVHVTGTTQLSERHTQFQTDERNS